MKVFLAIVLFLLLDSCAHGQANVNDSTVINGTSEVKVNINDLTNKFLYELLWRVDTATQWSIDQNSTGNFQVKNIPANQWWTFDLYLGTGKDTFQNRIYNWHTCTGCDTSKHPLYKP